MRIRVGTLRRIIREMKLGVAGAEGDARHWGKKPLPDERMAEPGGPMIAADKPHDFDPGEDVKALYRPRGGIDMAGDDIDDELEDDLAADVEKTRPMPKQKPTGMKGNIPLKSARG